MVEVVAGGQLEWISPPPLEEGQCTVLRGDGRVAAVEVVAEGLGLADLSVEWAVGHLVED